MSDPARQVYSTFGKGVISLIFTFFRTDLDHAGHFIFLKIHLKSSILCLVTQHSSHE